MGVLGDELLQTFVREEYTAIRNILDVGDGAILSRCVEGGEADAQHRGSLLAGKQFFHRNVPFRVGIFVQHMLRNSAWE